MLDIHKVPLFLWKSTQQAGPGKGPGSPLGRNVRYGCNAREQSLQLHLAIAGGHKVYVHQ